MTACSKWCEEKGKDVGKGVNVQKKQSPTKNKDSNDDSQENIDGGEGEADETGVKAKSKEEAQKMLVIYWLCLLRGPVKHREMTGTSSSGQPSGLYRMAWGTMRYYPPG